MNTGVIFGLLIIQIFVMMFLITAILILIRTRNNIKLEKKFSRYTISPINNNVISLFDRIENYYDSIVKKFSKLLVKCKIFDRYASIYEKFWIKICFRIQYNRPLYLPQTYKILVFRLHKRKTFDLQATGAKKRQIAIIPFSPVRMR